MEIRQNLLLLFVGLCFFQSVYCQQQVHNTAVQVKPVLLNTIDPDLFSEEEWYVPYYLKNFVHVANSVLDTGVNKGFIDIVVWRTPDVNKPYNARIMESILSLVWFYTRQRPWNPYYADPALRNKIETALTFWCNMQNDDGRFSEYGHGQWSLAPTAFAMKFIGRALYLLKEGPSIDHSILERTRQAMRKAFYVSFTDERLWHHGRNFTNQYENLWGGVLMYLKHFPDVEIEKLFLKRLEESMREFQSRCGYFYEKNGPDWGYNLSTHHSDLHVAWHYVKGTTLEKYFLEKTQLWYDWFSYNAVKEPGAPVYYLNKAVETRQQRWAVRTDTLENPSSMRWVPQAEVVPMARAFALSKEEYSSATKLLYKKMRDLYPQVDELKKGQFWAFSPYAFLHNELIMWLPSDTQKEEAVNDLPYLRNENFNHVRRDNRNNTCYSFVRRPSYYATFNSGTILTPLQRYGLGLLWNPAMGSVLQSQSNSDVAAWGTKASGSSQVYEAGDFQPKLRVDGKHWEPSAGKNELKGQFQVSYPLKNVGSKTIEFYPDKIKVTVNHNGNFTEVIPLLANASSAIRHNNKTITLENNKRKMTIALSTPTNVRKLAESISTRSEKACYVIEVQASGKLVYEISF